MNTSRSECGEREDSANALEDTELILQHCLGVPFERGNAARLLNNGTEIFSAMLKALESTEESVDFCTFVYWRGDIAERFARALAACAIRGVQVRVLLDSFGAHRMADRLIKLMRDGGVEVRWFRPLSTWRVWRSDKRTHRKLLICDNLVGFTGGVGIASEWEGDARNPNEWRDTHLEIWGPAVSGLAAAFRDNWNEAGMWQFDSKVAKPQAHSQDIPIQIVRASSTVGWTNIATLVRTLISMSRQSLYLTTAYFCPGHDVVSLLVEARKRGVDVRLLLPGKYTDSRVSQLAGQPLFGTLLEADIKIWRYQKTLLHAKTITVDEQIACVGSANLNHRSLSKDEECTAVLLSPALASELNKSFADDCANATPLSSEEWPQRSITVKVQERLARLVVEQL